MSDYVKEEPANASQAQQPKKSSAAPIVITLVVIFVGLPILFAGAIMIFVFANFDKIADWAERNTNRIFQSNDSSMQVDEERARSFSKIVAETKDDTLRETAGISKVDCQNVMAQIESNTGSKYYYFCNESSLYISSEDKKDKTVLHIHNQSSCLSLTLHDNYRLLQSIAYDTNTKNCSDGKAVKLTDNGEKFIPIKGYEDEELQELQRS